MKQVNKLTKRQRLEYLCAVALHLVERGYTVKRPRANDDSLIVWGLLGKRGRARVNVEVYAYSIHRTDHGVVGYWDLPQDDDPTQPYLSEMYLDDDELYGLDTRWSIAGRIADVIRPFKKGRVK